MASIGTQSKDTQDQHRKILANLLKKPENQECFDCTGRNPTWASINLGVFLCIRCAGLHRQLGVHITKVRSATMDLWQPDQIAVVQRMGNAKGKFYYEATLPKDYGKPSENEDSDIVMQWLRVKYEQKKYWGTPEQAAAAAAAAAAGGVLDTTACENKTKDAKKRIKRKSGGASGGLSPRARPLTAKSDTSASPVQFAEAVSSTSPTPAAEKPTLAAPAAVPQARASNVCSVFALQVKEQPSATVAPAQTTVNRAVRGGRSPASASPVQKVPVESESSSDESSDDSDKPPARPQAAAAQVTPGAQPLQRGESFMNFMKAAREQQAQLTAAPAQPPAVAPAPAAPAAPVAAPAAPAPAPPAASFLTFDEPQKPKVDDDFFASLGSGSTQASKPSILETLNQPSLSPVNVPPPTVSPVANVATAANGQSASAIEAKIRELQAMQEQLTQQIARSSPTPAGAATTPFDPFASLPAAGGPPSGSNSPPPLGGPGFGGPSPPPPFGTGAPPLGGLGAPPVPQPQAGKFFDPFSSVGGPPPLAHQPTPMAPRPGMVEAPLRTAKPAHDPFASLLS